MKHIKHCWILLVTLTLIGCSTADIQRHVDTEPLLSVRDFFNGQLVAHGLVKNRSGEVIRHFTAKIDASWAGKTGTLDEHFVFSDGEKQQRIWTPTEQPNGSFLAKANDVIGEHPMFVAGNALFMKYVLQLAYNGGSLDVTVDDRMFLVTENRIINESIFSKFGIQVASVQLVIEKSP